MSLLPRPSVHLTLDAELGPWVCGPACWPMHTGIQVCSHGYEPLSLSQCLLGLLQVSGLPSSVPSHQCPIPTSCPLSLLHVHGMTWLWGPCCSYCCSTAAARDLNLECFKEALRSPGALSLSSGNCEASLCSLGWVGVSLLSLLSSGDLCP